MRLEIFTEPQEGAAYDDLLALASRAEECGFNGFFRSDHYLSMGGLATGGGDGLPGPTDAGSRWPRWRCRRAGSGSGRL